MKKEIQLLRKKLNQHNIDGYVVPKNDDYFNSYSKINRLKLYKSRINSHRLWRLYFLSKYLMSN